jgi:16S rRNA (cytosine1402-N4)-methyltransferase
MDLDKFQAQVTQERLEKLPHQATLIVELGNFAGIDQALGKNGLWAPQGILADLGISSMQIDDPLRGFSYRREGPLDMRMDSTRGESAREILEKISPEDLAEALEEFGDMPLAAPFARTLLKRHKTTPFATTTQLAEFCLEWQKGSSPKSGGQEWKLRVGKKKWETHPAARVFQTLRILVNRELANLKHLLRLLPDILAPGGTVSMLSFHSGEDRLVKTAFEQGLRQGKYSQTSDGPIRASFEEKSTNPRSRSAKLRWARKAPSAE